MFHSARITVPLLLLPFLTQCGSGPVPSTGAVTGPFDSRGNYVEAWADSPEKWLRPTAPPERKEPENLIASNDTAPPPQIPVVVPLPQDDRPASASPTPTTVKPKPVVVKPKPTPKPKPKVVKYTVKKGDTLGRIASRNSCSLSALRRANGISGDLIRPGQVLTIPK